MSDQCKHCIYRGNIDFCRSVECYQHESWYAQQQISEIQSLKQELSGREWVSVEKELPKEPGFYLVYVPEAEMAEINVAAFTINTWHTGLYQVTHWMPLPPSPDIAKGE